MSPRQLLLARGALAAVVCLLVAVEGRAAAPADSVGVAADSAGVAPASPDSVPAPAPLDPAAELVRSRIETLREDGRLNVRGAWLSSRTALPALYEASGFRRLWDEARAEQLLRAVREAGADGLDPRDYHVAVLETLARETARGARAPGVLLCDRDLVLTDAFTRLWSHLRFGKLEARADSVPPDPRWNLRRTIDGRDAVDVLRELIDAGDIGRAVADARPDHPLYTGLREALADHRARAAAGGWPTVPPGPVLRPGQREARVLALRRRLAATGEWRFPGPLPDTSLAYDDALADAVRAFQRRHGLPEDAVVGPRTQAALAATAGERVGQLRAGLERCRQLLRDLGPAYVVVNIPDQSAALVTGGRAAWATRAMVGKPLRQTPSFRATMTYLVLNPKWTVPEVILERELIPGMQSDPTTLAKRHLRLIDRDGAEMDPSAVDWSAVTARGFPWLVRQDPGPDNPLGRVKFMLPNDYQIYLHDTPRRALFERSRRAASSGCIRLEDPLGLAERLLAGQDLPVTLRNGRAPDDGAIAWSRAVLDSVIATGETVTVPLARPLPVLLLYLTAWQDESGATQFREDLYGRDAPLLERLDARFTAAD